MIMVGIAVGVAVIVFVTALIEGLQSNIIERTLGTQSHIRLLSPDEVNVLLPVAPGTLQLVQEDIAGVEPIAQPIDSALRAASSAADLTRKLLA